MLQKIIGVVNKGLSKILPGKIQEVLVKQILKGLALNAVRETEKQISLKGPEKLRLALKLISIGFQRKFGIPLPVDLIPDSVLNYIVEEAVSQLKRLGEEIKKNDIK